MTANPALRAGPLELDPASYAATLNGGALSLSATEFDILYHLAANHGRVYDCGQLYEATYGHGNGQYRDPTTVRVMIYRLRKKLGDHHSLVGTVRGRGYRCTVEAAPVDRPAGPPVAHTDCRSPTVDLINGLRAIAGVLRGRPIGVAEQEALAGLRADEDVRWLLGGAVS